MEIIDTHVHLLRGNQFKYDWTEDIEVLKSQNFSLEQYSEIALAAGVTKAIFMETAVNTEFYKSESLYAKTLADDSETMIESVIAGCFPEKNKGFDAWLEQTADTGYVGYRRILHTEPDELSQSNTFIANVTKIGELNKCFDMCFLQRQLPLAINLAKKCKNTQFILDHCGVPDIAGGDFNNWSANISKLAELENVTCKISGLLAYCQNSKNAPLIIKPYVEYCIEAFGWNRVIWGGDWPVINMTSNLPAWLVISKNILSNEEHSNQGKLFSKNAMKVYNL